MRPKKNQGPSNNLA